MSVHSDLINEVTAKSKSGSFFCESEHGKIKSIVERLGKTQANEKSHGRDVHLSILESAKKSASFFTQNARSSSAIAVMDVILAAHRDYNKQVLNHVLKLRETYPKLTFCGLARLLQEYPTATSFKEIWGHNDEGKFQTLCAVIEKILPLLDGQDDIKNDFEVMERWATSASLKNRKDDVIGSVKNIGVATYQHLRMNFGVNTLKPDQRVKEVLKNEFELDINATKAILAVEEIAEICGMELLVVDQIFVRYGSGYYRRDARKKGDPSVQEIIKKLKVSGVEISIISNATGWTHEDVRNT